MTYIVRTALAAALLSLSASCSQQPAEDPSTNSGDSDDASNLPGKSPNEAAIKVDRKITDACGISETEAYFQYNSSKVSKEAAGLFKKLAECFTTGPLKGETMLVVGHADPRGEDEYNMTLGGLRSGNVSKEVIKAGLPEAQSESSSRGEMDAKGTDEASWKADRRVDILLSE